MAENINGFAYFGTGGHVWNWAARPMHDKRVRVAGMDGETRLVLSAGAVPGTISGILKGTGTSKADADISMNLIEAAIEALVNSGSYYPAEDDSGRVIECLSVDEFAREVTDRDRACQRAYGRTGSVVNVWQRYTVKVTNLTGVFG